VAQPAPQPAPAAPAGEPCAACIKFAASGDIPAASRAYAQCSDATARRKCTSRAAPKAVQAAQAAAYNQKCDQARVIMAAAVAMGVPDRQLANAQNACK
jgi:hypothetical protein